MKPWVTSLSLKFYLRSMSINSNETGGLLLFIKMIIDCSFGLHMTVYVCAAACTVTQKRTCQENTTFTHVSTVTQM